MPFVRWLIYETSKTEQKKYVENTAAIKAKNEPK